MKRAASYLFSVTIMLGGVAGPASPARAASVGLCTIQSEHAEFADPLNRVPRDSNFSFYGTMECTGTADLNGSWDIDVSSETTGLYPIDPAVPTGETCAFGRSRNPGSFSASGPVGRVLNGSFEFQRIGVAIRAWGVLTDDDFGSYDWRGLLVLVPQPVADGSFCGQADPMSGIRSANLVGPVSLVG